MKLFTNVSFGNLLVDARVGRDLAAPGGKLLSQRTISTSEMWCHLHAILDTDDQKLHFF